MGGTGDDTLDGGPGSDTLEGGWGADVFVFGLIQPANVVGSFKYVGNPFTEGSPELLGERLTLEVSIDCSLAGASVQCENLRIEAPLHSLYGNVVRSYSMQFGPVTLDETNNIYLYPPDNPYDVGSEEIFRLFTDEASVPTDWFTYSHTVTQRPPPEGDYSAWGAALDRDPVEDEVIYATSEAIFRGFQNKGGEWTVEIVPANTDTVTDFTPGEDQLDLTAFAFPDFDAVTALAEQVDGDTLIRLNEAVATTHCWKASICSI